MTEYDLQLHLRDRNSIWNKETEIKYLTQRMSQIFLGKIILFYTEKRIWRGQGYEFEGLFKI